MYIWHVYVYIYNIISVKIFTTTNKLSTYLWRSVHKSTVGWTKTVGHHYVHLVLFPWWWQCDMTSRGMARPSPAKHKRQNIALQITTRYFCVHIWHSVINTSFILSWEDKFHDNRKMNGLTTCRLLHGNFVYHQCLLCNMIIATL